MNILMVFHAPPYPPDIGPSRRHYHELVELLARGHAVSVLSYGDAGDGARFLAHFGNRCGRVRFVPLHASAAAKGASRCWALARGRSDFARLRTRRMQRALDRMAASARFDVISCSTTMLGALRLPRGVPLVGDTHNVEFDNLARAYRETPPGPLRQYFRLQAALTKREEIAYARRFDIVCVTSDRDRRVLHAAAPDARVMVVPNGVDLDEFQPHPGPREAATIVFTGLMSYYPNSHGVRFFIREILPAVCERVPRARLLVVGADPPAALRQIASERIVVTGYVPDVRPFLGRASAYVIPLRIGGGTRVKALQAMAMGIPIVSTALGCEGLDLRDGEQALLADTPEAFAAAVVRLLQEPVLGERLARSASAHVRRYAWSRVGNELNEAFAAAARVIPHGAAALTYAANPH